ncbi:outer membrane beta-barrel protein [Pontibacter roseus]|uniref:outer membrane beta-barrel protein n=1 Tax=Pontibacter roseus TaxID=336989 RepID=UPI00036294D2|nr:outer membrane beta-barrel protein [Pontibacter roseus]
MKKKLLTSLINLCLFSAAQAQDSLQVKHHVSAPYKVAVGIRYSAGGPTGVDLGITGKFFFSRQSALEVHSTINPNARNYLASLSYIWQPKLATSERIRPYAGIGMGIIRPDSKYYDNETTQSNLVVIPTIGIEYQFRRLPIAVSLDYRSTLMRVGGGSYNLNLRNTSNLGLGLKYTFR